MINYMQQQIGFDGYKTILFYFEDNYPTINKVNTTETIIGIYALCRQGHIIGFALFYFI